MCVCVCVSACLCGHAFVPKIRNDFVVTFLFKDLRSLAQGERHRILLSMNY